ncbi:acyltransferase family protein [Novosphingobium aquimarinum]|uniref:acyltransferase family protein n=1 Tax=Novosphingobium aquimarinum TaxID=2682494 RepID=UPI0012EC290E|nr:acyltransferase [Novosphingobium aquimarinum]
MKPAASYPIGDHEQASQGARHLPVLDGLRGIAALAVLIYHITWPLGYESIVPRGYLAVDLFFVLSGVVIAHVYDDRLRAGMTLGDFSLRRLIRLYPLIVLGALMGATVTLGDQVLAQALALGEVTRNLLLALLLLPFGSSPDNDYVFPTIGPLWSLHFELVINLVFAATFRIWTKPAIAALVVFALWGLGLHAMVLGSVDGGGQHGEYAVGLLRVSFGFFAGVLLRRCCAFDSDRKYDRALAYALVAAVLLAPSARWGAVFDLVAVALVFPAAVYFGARSADRQGAGVVFAYLGRISYPLYLTHYPIKRVFQHFQMPLAEHTGLIAISILIEIAVCLAAAHLALVLYDGPIRRWLTTLSRRRPQAQTG